VSDSTGKVIAQLLKKRYTIRDVIVSRFSLFCNPAVTGDSGVQVKGQEPAMITGKILIIDANNLTDRSIKDRLRKWGHEVVQQKYSENLLADVAKVEPDLLILQVDALNEKVLLSCIRMLRKHKSSHRIPLLAVISDALIPLKKTLFQAGINDCLVLPVADAELKAHVEQHVKTVKLLHKLESTQKALEESLFKIKRQRTELDHHLTLAARIQESLIPHNLIQVPFCNFYCHFQPSGKVGGDIYDIFMLDESHLGLYMVDVMGHGVASSMLAVALSEFLVVDVSRGTPLKRELEEEPYYEIVSPLEVIRYLNKRFSFTKYQHYFTIFYMVFNVENGNLRYVRGAHPEPLLMRRDGTIETLNAYGTPIGFEFSQGYEEGEIQLKPGDRLLCYTDGLLELEDRNQRTLDYDALIQLAHQYMEKESGRPFAMQFKQLADRQVQLKDDLTLIEMVWHSI
jgi:phosphoserine phosphatase RsbU/P